MMSIFLARAGGRAAFPPAVRAEEVADLSVLLCLGLSPPPACEGFSSWSTMSEVEGWVLLDLFKVMAVSAMVQLGDAGERML